MRANVVGGVIIVVGIEFLLYGWLFLDSTIVGLSYLSDCQTPQYGVYEGNPNACYYALITTAVIGGVLFAAGLLVIRWGWRKAHPSKPDT